MEIYYSNNELYVDINDRINIDLINRLKNKLSIIMESYGIEKVNLNINSIKYNYQLINGLISELNTKYDSIFVVK